MAFVTACGSFAIFPRVFFNFFVVFRVTVLAVIMKGFGVVLTSLFISQFGLTFFGFFNFAGVFVAFDTFLDIIAFFEAGQSFALVIVMTVTAGYFVIGHMFFVGEGNRIVGMFFIGLGFHIKCIRYGGSSKKDSCNEH